MTFCDPWIAAGVAAAYLNLLVWPSLVRGWHDNQDRNAFVPPEPTFVSAFGTNWTGPQPAPSHASGNRLSISSSCISAGLSPIEYRFRDRGTWVM